MEEKPRVYQNKINKEFHNNRLVYTSYDNNTNKEVVSDVRNKIKNIINSNSFIYSKLVNIVINNQIVSKKIIGIKGNNLVTIDNELIPLDNIKDIYLK